MRQNAHEVMVQGAALIVGICGSIFMVASALVGVVESVINDARAGNVGHDVLLDRDDMLECMVTNGTIPATWAFRNNPRSHRP
jgi:hypothetical protein